MLFSTIGQGYVFLWMMAVGAVIGAWYGLLSALRRLLQAGFWLSLISDIAFGAGAAAIFIAGLVSANYGRVRLFVILAAALGFGLFAAGFYPPVRAAAGFLGRAICRIFVRTGQLRWIKVIFR